MASADKNDLAPFSVSRRFHFEYMATKAAVHYPGLYHIGICHFVHISVPGRRFEVAGISNTRKDPRDHHKRVYIQTEFFSFPIQRMN
jgi:hypothetical protein